MVEKYDERLFAGEWIEVTKRDKWKKAWYKLLVFGMSDFKRLIFLDSDTLVLQDISELFFTGPFVSAEMDVVDHPFYCQHKEIFEERNLNSGLMVFQPSTQLYERMVSQLAVLPPQGIDQKFIQLIFPDFSSLPVTYGFMYDLCHCYYYLPQLSLKTVHMTTSWPVETAYHHLKKKKKHFNEKDKCFWRIAVEWKKTLNSLYLVKSGKCFYTEEFVLKCDNLGE